MASNQTPDRSHASGTFIPVVAPPFTADIVNSNGVRSFDRNGPGNYTVVLATVGPGGEIQGDPLAFAEGIASAELPANFLGICGAQIAPDGLSVLLTVFDLGGKPADPPIISFKVTSVEEGEGKGPEPDLPDAPSVALGLRGLGWASVDADGTILAQTGAVLTVVPNPVGAYDYTLKPGLAAIAALAATVNLGNGSAGQPGYVSSQILSATTAESNIRDTAGVLANRAHFMYFYSL